MSLALLGRLLVLASLGFAAAGAVAGFAAGQTGSRAGLKWTRGLAYAFAAAMILANLVMEYALITHDFSVSYVAHVGSRATPLHITIVSLWSSLEGSILFWGFVLATLVAIWTWTMRGKHEDLVPYSLGTMLAVAAFFGFLLAGPANPFLDTPAPVPTDGPGPNPLLQNHVLMIVHPPMLYLGYVGMTIPFAMGVAALLRGRLGAAWMRPIRRWMLLPWGFLTIGIVLGGWWAYEVLGWGGYWAWDPVENASLLPWLTGTAFLHSAMLQSRRGILKAWTLVLLLATFALTILGTFMTRSGVFNSVHSFTQSPIGPTFLVFLAVVSGLSIVLLAFRMHLLTPEGAIRSPASREAAFVFNNLLFVALTFTVLVGTTYPLLAEAIRGIKVSVGEPFFNRFAVPLGVAIVFLMGIGPALPWGRATSREALRALLGPVLVGVVVALLGAFAGARDLWPALTLFAAGFASAVALRDMVVPVRARMTAHGESLGRAVGAALKRGRRRYGGQVVHLGVVLCAVSIALSGSYQTITEGIVNKDETMQVGAYEVTFRGTRQVQEAHRVRVIAAMDVARNGKALGQLEPAMNYYERSMSPIGTPAVRTGAREDLYLSVMHLDERGKFVGLRAFVNPAVAWLWIGMLVMAFGTALAAWPSGMPRREAADAPAPAPAPREEVA